jgi:glycosyltransferase involved in cell wall biosynthesis
MKDLRAHMVVLLNKGFIFPHTLNHFPLSAYLVQWLSENPQNRATIITPTPIVHSVGISGQIDIAYINSSNSKLSGLKYKLIVRMKLLSIRLNGIINHQNNGRLIVLKLDKLTGKDLVLTDPVFIPLDETKKELVKKTLANESEYFICTAKFDDIKNFIFLLKAFSILKKRLRSGIKLMLTGIHPDTHPRLFQQIRQYKYRSDLIVPNNEVAYDYATLAGAAYAQIFPSYDLISPSGRWEAVKMGVPVVLPENDLEKKDDTDCFYFFKKDSVDDLAEKMMLLYKDESLRKKIIQQSLQIFQIKISENKDMDRFPAILRNKGL